MSELTLSTELHGPVAVVALAGELDVAGVGALDAELDRLLASPDGPRVLLVDLTSLAFIDSTGLRSLVLADRRVAESDRRFVLVPGREPVQRVFEITRMDKLLTFVSDVREAAALGTTDA